MEDAEDKWPRTGDQVELFEFIVTRDPREGLAMTESGNHSGAHNTRAKVGLRTASNFSYMR